MDTPVTRPADAPGSARPLHPLVQRLVEKLGAPMLATDTFDDWARLPGHALVFFTEDPARHAETLDLAVVVPELVAAFPGRFRTGVLPPEAARALAGRFGFRRWPALVLLKDGQHVGAIDGLRDWSDYIASLTALLDAEPSRPPGIGVAVRVAGQGAGASGCH